YVLDGAPAELPELQAKGVDACAQAFRLRLAEVAGAHELHQRSPHPSAKVLRRGVSIHAGGTTARGAAAESEGRRSHALNLRPRSRWRSGAPLNVDGGGSAGSLMVLLPHGALPADTGGFRAWSHRLRGRFLICGASR